MIIKSLVKLVPKRFLPKNYRTAHNVQTGETQRLRLSEAEERDWLERLINHHIKLAYQKYLPFYFIKQKYIKFRRNKNEEELTFLIGRITLLCADIEQLMKKELNELFSLKHNKTLHGKQLIKTFKKSVSTNNILLPFMDRYIDLLDRYSTLADERNEKVKALYSYDEKTGDPSKVDYHNFYEVRNKLTQGDNVSNDEFFAWIKPIKLEEYKALISSLENLRSNWINISGEVFSFCIHLRSEVASQTLNKKSN
jgi:hypothetical protein